MSSGSLFLGAPAEGMPPARDTLLGKLINIGLIGAAYREQESRFLTGERFPQLITFMGCSPYLQLKPSADDSAAFCHVHLIGPLEQPCLIHGNNTRPPRCSHCKKPLEQWRALLDTDSTFPENQLVCRKCRQPGDPVQFIWRRDAGFSRFFVRIYEVFPGEAVPVPELLKALQGEGKEWNYFYVQDPVLGIPPLPDERI